jgi:hypothetical protein
MNKPSDNKVTRIESSAVSEIRSLSEASRRRGGYPISAPVEHDTA